MGLGVVDGGGGVWSRSDLGGGGDDSIPDPNMEVAVSPPPGMMGQLVGPCGGAGGDGSWDPVLGDVIGRWRRILGSRSWGCHRTRVVAGDFSRVDDT